MHNHYKDDQVSPLVAGRRIYKMPKPEDVPTPPEGYGYVGMGVPGCAFIKKQTGIAIRFVPHSAEETAARMGDYLSPIGMWGEKRLQGLRDFAHYAVPMHVWARIEYPPELNKPANQH